MTIAELTIPDSKLAREAEDLVRSVSDEVLYNHVMRCYFFGQMVAHAQGTVVDRELMFLSSVLHDLGLTDQAKGTHRFEIEGACAARSFLVERGVPAPRAQEVWDNIAMHNFDFNLYRSDTSRCLQLGILYDVVGVAGMTLDAIDVSAVVRQYPRRDFKRAFYKILESEVAAKQPYQHFFHICSMIESLSGPVSIPDPMVLLDNAPFDE
ncbi:diguanylate cyclase [Microbacterium sp. RD1]|uniref:diguanylate cyclase n=1 Tax=Microbacterium sp. RD1 TaxID=3457313 RepID=UPI003FA576C2